MSVRRLAPCTPVFPSLSSPVSSRQSSGVWPLPFTAEPSTHTPSQEVMGRLDHLVEAVYDRFKDRYFKDESAFAVHYRVLIDSCPSPEVIVEIEGVKQVPLQLMTFILTHVPLRYYGLVMKVYPPRFKSDEQRKDTYDESSLNHMDEEAHVIGSDLGIPLPDANQRDDPELYYYWIYILEFEKEKGEKGKKEVMPQVIGSTMECHCRIMRYLCQSP